MVIWGKGEGSNVLGEMGEHDCPVCEKRTPFQAVLNYTYRHVWYVFSWITGREYAAVCGNCGNGAPMDAAEAKKMFPNDGLSFMRKKGWIVGLALIIMVFGVGMFVDAKDKEQYQAYLASPQVGDVYLANLATIEGGGYEKAGKAAYGFMKLVRVNEDTRTFVLCTTAYSKKKGVRKALSSASEKNKYDTANPVMLSADKVRGMYDQKIIYEIRR